MEENCSTYAFSDESGAVYRHNEKISFEKEVVSIDLILRISLVMRGDLEREGTVKTDRIAEWSDKAGKVNVTSVKILEVVRVMSRSSV